MTTEQLFELRELQIQLRNVTEDLLSLKAKPCEREPGISFIQHIEPVGVGMREKTVIVSRYEGEPNEFRNTIASLLENTKLDIIAAHESEVKRLVDEINNVFNTKEA